MKAFAKAEEAARAKRAAKREKDKKTGKGKSTEKDRKQEEADAGALPSSINVLLHFAFSRQGLVVLEKAMVSPADKNRAPTVKLSLADIAAASQAPSANGAAAGAGGGDGKRGGGQFIFQPQPLSSAQRRKGVQLLSELRERDARRAAADAAMSELEVRGARVEGLRVCVCERGGGMGREGGRCWRSSLARRGYIILFLDRCFLLRGGEGHGNYRDPVTGSNLSPELRSRVLSSPDLPTLHIALHLHPKS